MVVFITLEEKVEEYVPKDEAQDYIVQNLVENIEHKEDCKVPEIKLTYDKTADKIDATYDNSRKVLIAGCTCGATVSKDISQGYSAAMEESKNPCYGLPSESSYSNNNPVAESYY